jgi:hypothetical protein
MLFLQWLLFDRLMGDGLCYHCVPHDGFTNGSLFCYPPLAWLYVAVLAACQLCSAYRCFTCWVNAFL